MVDMTRQMQDAEKAPEPGARAGEVLDPGSSDKPSVTMGSVESAGYVYIYNTETYERSKCNQNMLRRKLLETRPDGSYIWATRLLPGQEPTRGQLKCLLHADSEQRAYYDTLGLPTCGKSNLTSPFQQQMHMQRKHKTEWATIEQQRIATERQEDRDLYRGVIKLSRKGAKKRLIWNRQAK